MIKLLRKEIQLAASPLSYFFIGFGLMAFVPGYPILVGSFFVCLGLFQSFQTAREANDLTYTALLPVAKRDVVRAKYAFCCFIEICYFTLTGAVTLIRMTLLSNAAVYRNNVLMNANLVYLAFVLLILGLFFGFRYRFSGPDLEREELNGVMGGVADTAADLGRQVMDELNRQRRNPSETAQQAQRQAEDIERQAADLERHIEDELLGGGKDG